MKWYHYSIILIIPLGSTINAQLTTYLENFNDNKLTGWDWNPGQTTFTLTEADQILQILYTRTDSSWEWDNFNFTPPQPVDVNANPVISLGSTFNHRYPADIETDLLGGEAQI